MSRDVQKTKRRKRILNVDTVSGKIALDSSVIIEMLISSPQGEAVTGALISESAEAYSSEVNLAEAEYVLCRKLGVETARSKINLLRRSNYITITDTESVSRIAAEIKCERALAIGDCYTLATAKLTGSKAIFAFREVELQREVTRRPCKVEVIFLEDLQPISS